MANHQLLALVWRLNMSERKGYFLLNEMHKHSAKEIAVPSCWRNETWNSSIERLHMVQITKLNCRPLALAVAIGPFFSSLDSTFSWYLQKSFSNLTWIAPDWDIGLLVCSNGFCNLSTWCSFLNRCVYLHFTAKFFRWEFPLRITCNSICVIITFVRPAKERRKKAEEEKNKNKSTESVTHRLNKIHELFNWITSHLFSFSLEQKAILFASFGG